MFLPELRMACKGPKDLRHSDYGLLAEQFAIGSFLESRDMNPTGITWEPLWALSIY